MDPADFIPKNDLKGNAKETDAFEGSVDSTGAASGIKPDVATSRHE